MPEITSKDVPTSGPGSQTPQQVPAMHTPVGQGVEASGVNNLNKTPGKPGAPTKPVEGGAPSSDAAPGSKGPSAPALAPQKTPEQQLDERSLKSLSQDLKDIALSSGEDLSLDDLLDKLINEKEWRVDRLKELIPTRDEAAITSFLKGLTKESNPGGVQPKMSHSITNKRGYNMEGLVVSNGTLVSSDSLEQKLDKIAQKISDVEFTKTAVFEAKIRQAGLDALKGDLGLGKPEIGGMDSFGGGDDVPSLIKELKGKIDELTSMMKDFDKSKGSSPIGADTALKADALKEKGKKEIESSKPLFEDPKKEEKKPEMGSAPEKKEEAPKEEKKEEAKAASAELVVTKVAEEEKAEEKKEEKGEEMESEKKEEAKAAFEALRAKLAYARERKSAQLYPFSDKNKQQQTNINNTMAKDAAKTINSDMNSGDMTKDKSKGFLGENFEKAGLPSTTMTPSQKAKMSSDQSITLKQAAKKVEHEVKEATSKARLAVELAAMQQLKGLIPNPLKEAMIKELRTAGVDEAIADVCVHNAFIEAFEASQKELVNEAFDTFMGHSFDDFTKVAKFTKEYKFAQDSSVKEEVSGQVKTASVALRGTETSDKSGEGFTSFWRNSYAEQTGRNVR